METVKVRALASFTEVTPKGMKVFNAPKGDQPGTEDDLLVARAAERFEAGQIEYVDAEEAPAPPPTSESDGGESPPSLTTSEIVGELVTDAPLAGVGEAIQIPGAADADDQPIPSVATSPFMMTLISGGRYTIQGPGIPADTIIKGKKDALEYIELAEKAHAEMEAALAAQQRSDDSQDAPV